MDIGEYRQMLRKQDADSLVGILGIIDPEQHPERARAVREELERRKGSPDVAESARPADPIPAWKIQKNWHRINAVLVGMVSAVAFYSAFTATETGLFIHYIGLYFAVTGLLGVLFYFWKFKIGHYLLLLWWLPQLLQLETPIYRYSVSAGLKFGIGFQIGTMEITANLIAMTSFAWLILFKKYYANEVKVA